MSAQKNERNEAWWSALLNLKIATKIWLGFSLLVAGFALTTFLGYQQTANQKAMIAMLSEETFPSTQLAQKAMATFDIQTKYYNDAVIMGEAELLDKARESSQALESLLQQVQANATGEEAQEEALAGLMGEVRDFTREAHRVYSALSGFDVSDAVQKEAAQLADRQRAIESRLETLNEVESDLLLATLQKMEAGSQRQIKVSLAMFLTMLTASAGGIFFILAHGVTRPLQQAVALANSVRDGDLSHRLQIRTRDEIGQLAQALNSMADGLARKAEVAETIANGDLTQEVEVASPKDTFGKSLAHMVANLNTMIREVRSASGRVSIGSEAIFMNSQELSNGASSQAASLEEITAAITDLTGQVKLNADNASAADKQTDETQASAVKGSEEMGVLTSAMSDISQASEEIAKIIKVIDDIAFQTNLLALNAAVEAARAGKHGKGFAVVAEEVRNLAGRSAKAARETAELIETTLEKVDNGNDLTTRTGAAFADITAGVAKATELVTEISQASTMQARGIEEISTGMQQVDAITQTNAASSQEMASASEDLRKQADDLQTILSRFKLKGEAGGPVQQKAIQDFEETFDEELILG